MNMPLTIKLHTLFPTHVCCNDYDRQTDITSFDKQTFFFLHTLSDGHELRGHGAGLGYQHLRNLNEEGRDGGRDYNYRLGTIDQSRADSTVSG